MQASVCAVDWSFSPGRSAPAADLEGCQAALPPFPISEQSPYPLLYAQADAGIFSLRLLFSYYSFCTRRARMAFKIARIITPTSAKTASHILATPNATRTRQTNFTAMENTIFW